MTARRCSGARSAASVDRRKPVVVRRRGYARVDRHEEFLHVGKDAKVDCDILVYRRRVAVNMDDLRAAGELRSAPARDAVVETNAKRKEEIRLCNRGIRGKFAVEPGKAKREGIGLVKRANAHQSRCNGNPGLVRKRGNVLRRAGRNDAAARKNHGALCAVYEFREAAHLRRRSGNLGMVGPQENALGIGSRSERLLTVTRHVYYDRSWLAVRRDIERLGNRLWYLVG